MGTGPHVAEGTQPAGCWSSCRVGLAWAKRHGVLDPYPGPPSPCSIPTPNPPCSLTIARRAVCSQPPAAPSPLLCALPTMLQPAHIHKLSV